MEKCDFKKSSNIITHCISVNNGVSMIYGISSLIVLSILRIFDISTILFIEIVRIDSLILRRLVISENASLSFILNNERKVDQNICLK